MEYIAVTSQEDDLQHHGILGQKWGVRRFQNEDGTLTEAGKQRYNEKLANDAIEQISKYSELNDYFRGGSAISAYRASKNENLVEIVNTVSKNQDELKEIASDPRFKEFGRSDGKADDTENLAIGGLAYHLSTYVNLEDMTLSRFDWACGEAVWEDGTQNKFEGVPIRQYRRDPDSYDDFVDKVDRYKEINSENYKAVVDYVKTYGSYQINKLNSETYVKAMDVIANASKKIVAGDSVIDESDDMFWLSYVGKFTDSEKKCISTAETYVKKIPNASSRSDGWEFLNTALGNLGYSGEEKIVDLSDSDWDKINKEIARISRGY